MTEHTIEAAIGEGLIANAKNNALAFVCFILLNNEAKTDPKSWTVWSDDGGAGTFGDSAADEETKAALWQHVVVCEKEERCFDGCKRARKVILGKAFDSVCTTAIKFENPDEKAVRAMKKMVEIRMADILKSTGMPQGISL